jgi:hypothetical protein
MEINRERSVKYHVTFDEEDARWLRKILQNNLLGGDEPTADYDRRVKLFHGLAPDVRSASEPPPDQTQ